MSNIIYKNIIFQLESDWGILEYISLITYDLCGKKLNYTYFNDVADNNICFDCDGEWCKWIVNIHVYTAGIDDRKY